jgi:hypothetical protein
VLLSPLIDREEIAGGKSLFYLWYLVLYFGRMKEQGMRIFKNRAFCKWATKAGLGDEALLAAIDEIEHGLIDANLGGHVLKKRIALSGCGKSGGVRTLLVYKLGDRAFFVYGFAKNARANINVEELKALKAYANVLLNYSDKELRKAVKAGVLIEVLSNG